MVVSRGRSSRRRDASGRFLLRIDAGLHDALRAAAREANLSLNEYCVRTLAGHATALAASADATRIVTDAARFLGGDLIGVVLYGSWTRGELAAGSDVDVLIVADTPVELTRDLYRRWDSGTHVWSGRCLDAHFTHLPDPRRSPSGLWAEVATDGIVLFERGLRVSEYLVRVRRDIAAGRLVRRVVHGQPYWTTVA